MTSKIDTIAKPKNILSILIDPVVQASGNQGDFDCYWLLTRGPYELKVHSTSNNSGGSSISYWYSFSFAGHSYLSDGWVRSWKEAIEPLERFATRFLSEKRDLESQIF
jgi:hypothetical protein